MAFKIGIIYKRFEKQDLQLIDSGACLKDSNIILMNTNAYSKNKGKVNEKSLFLKTFFFARYWKTMCSIFENKKQHTAFVLVTTCGPSVSIKII